MRHAKAVKLNADLTDYKRPLTEHIGEGQVRSTAHWLDQQPEFNPQILGHSGQAGADYMMVSAATRTQQTWNYLMNYLPKWHVKEVCMSEKFYHAEVSDWLHYLRSDEDRYPGTTRFIMGHNPVIGELATYLIDKTRDLSGIGENLALGMNLASVAVIRFAERSWSQISQYSGQLVDYYSP